MVPKKQTTEAMTTQQRIERIADRMTIRFHGSGQTLRYIIKEALTAFAEDQWQPIETAPKDVWEVLLTDGQIVASGFWHDGSECYGHRGGEGWFSMDDRYKLLTASNFPATHWKPLPPAPSTGEKPE